MLLSSRAWLDSNIKRPEFCISICSLLEDGIECCRKTCFYISLLSWRNCRKLYKTVFLLAAHGTMIFLSRKQVLSPIQSKCCFTIVNPSKKILQKSASCNVSPKTPFPCTHFHLSPLSAFSHQTQIIFTATDPSQQQTVRNTNSVLLPTHFPCCITAMLTPALLQTLIQTK